jgi:hypothetical protein
MKQRTISELRLPDGKWEISWERKKRIVSQENYPIFIRELYLYLKERGYKVIIALREK